MCVILWDFGNQEDDSDPQIAVLEKATTEMFIGITKDTCLGFSVFFLLAVFKSVMRCCFLAGHRACHIGSPHLCTPGHIWQASPAKFPFFFFHKINLYIV